MRKVTFIILLISFAFCLTFTSSLAEGPQKDQKVKLQNDTVIADQVVEAGSYLAKLDDDGFLSLYRGRKLMLKTYVAVEPLGNVNPNSYIVNRNGILEEIRFNEEKAVFQTRSVVGRTAE
jgi:hypothetical protein